MTDRDKQNKLLAVAVCFFIFLTYLQNVWYPYLYPEKYNKNKQAQKEQIVSSAQSSSVADVAPEQQETPKVDTSVGVVPADEKLSSSGVVFIENDKIALEITQLGGRVKNLLLKDYAESVAKNSPRLNLIDHISGAPLPLGLYSSGIDDSLVVYEIESVSGEKKDLGSGSHLLLAQKDGASVVLKGLLPNGDSVKKTIVLHEGSYLVDVTLELPQAKPGRPYEIEWTRRMTKESPTLLNPYADGEIVWFGADAVGRKAFKSFESEAKKYAEAGNDIPYEFAVSDVQWLALEDVYFMTALVSTNDKLSGRVAKSPDLYRTRLALSTSNVTLKLYAGPKKLEVLEKANYSLDKNINLGRLAFIARPLMQLLQKLYMFLGNYGLAIILLTIFVKFAMLPVTVATLRQAKAMQDLQPEMQRIRESIKDKEQQQVKLMALYKEKGINPMGGCFPMLIQIPIFLGLYTAFRLSFELRHAPFALWIHDLSAKEALVVGGVGLPVMVILFVISMLVQQWTMPTNLDPTQKKVMMFMPFMFGFMFVNFPAGLTLYWLVNNIISITQQRALHKGDTMSAVKVTVVVSTIVLLIGLLLVKAS